MEDTQKQKRDYYRIDLLLPFRATVVPVDMRNELESHTGDFDGLKPRIVNLSGAGMAFGSKTEFSKGDILEIIMHLGLDLSVSVCVYGEIGRIKKTEAGLYRIFVAFVAISRDIRDMIVSFVFNHEREVLLNNLFAENNSARFGDMPLRRIPEETVFPFEIYAREKNTLKFLLGAGLFYDSIANEYFNERKITKIYVKPDDIPFLTAYLDRNRTKNNRFDREDPLSFKDYAFRKSQLFLIEKRLLGAGVDFIFDLYLMEDYNYRPLPLLSHERTEDILIKTSDISAYREYLVSIQQNSTANVSGLLIKEEAKMLLHDLIENPFDQEKMEETVICAARLVEHMKADMAALSNLITAGNEDHYPYNHMINVAILSIRTGLEMGLNREDIDRLAIGALLHDIGFASITDELIYKQGRLNSTEYSAFKTHVMEGMKILKEHRNVPEESYGAVLHHHEKNSGKGYPQGLSGSRISLFGKITAIADAYDILITRQPYREKKTPAEALRVIISKAADYGPEILKTVIKILSGPAKQTTL